MISLPPAVRARNRKDWYWISDTTAMESKQMTLDTSYRDIPGTTVFDAEMSRRGYGLNQFCMSLKQAKNRQRFKEDERAYLNLWPMSEAQKEAVLQRDFNRCIALGGNIYFLVKIGATDGISVQKMVSGMSGMTELAYSQMMLAGGRPPDSDCGWHKEQPQHVMKGN